MRRSRSDRGQAAVLLAAAMMVLVAVAAALVGLGAEGAGRARVQAVADLTALAGARSDVDGRRVAAANAATVVSVRQDGETVTVVVALDGRRAVAGATVGAR